MKFKHIVAAVTALAAVAVANAQEQQGSKRIMSRVKEIVTERCALCHGAEGESASGAFPRIAAQHPAYIVKQLRDFRDGRRKGTMNDMAADLKEDEIAGLAVYFSIKKPVAKKSPDTDLLAVGKYVFTKGNPYSGVAACTSCHGNDGHGTIHLPRLAGQHPSYLEGQMADFNKRERTNDNAIMHAIASKMTTLEIKAVSAYISGLD